MKISKYFIALLLAIACEDAPRSPVRQTNDATLLVLSQFKDTLIRIDGNNCYLTSPDFGYISTDSGRVDIHGSTNLLACIPRNTK